MQNIKIVNKFGKHASFACDAASLFNEVYNLMLIGVDVVVDFAGIESVSADFLQNFAGRLLQHVQANTLNRQFTIVNLPDKAKPLMKNVLENNSIIRVKTTA